MRILLSKMLTHRNRRNCKSIIGITALVCILTLFVAKTFRQASYQLFEGINHTPDALSLSVNYAKIIILEPSTEPYNLTSPGSKVYYSQYGQDRVMNEVSLKIYRFLYTSTH